MPYANNISHAPYPTPLDTSVYTIFATERAISEDLARAPYLTVFFYQWQHSTKGALSVAVGHRATSLQEYYESEGIPVYAGKDWCQKALDKDIARGDH